MSMREKLLQTKTLLGEVFIHDEYYIDATLASFASKSHLCLLGFRGSGKTHLMECLLKTIDSNIVTVQQGYLSAELEDIFARPDISKLMKGEEEVKFKKAVYSRIKAFDEIQRLGVGALSAMFRLLTTGTVIYLDKEEGVRPFWVIATANPSELSSDQLNIRLPEPLWDRFDGVLWIPSALSKFKYSLKINGKIERLKDSLPVIWSENELLRLWKETENITIPEDIELIITMILAMLSYCKYAQDYDASSITVELKRELCSKCTKTYICGGIARPPSVRAKISLMKIAKGFAYLRGDSKVELIDIEKAFPLVFWKRIEFMNDEYISDRLKSLRELFSRVKNELIEVKDGIEAINRLKNRYDGADYNLINNLATSKGWFSSMLEVINEYYNDLYNKLRSKYEAGDKITKAKIYFIAKTKLPREYASRFYFDEEVEVELNAKTLATLSDIDKNLFNEAKREYERGGKTYKLSGEQALYYIAFYGGGK